MYIVVVFLEYVYTIYFVYIIYVYIVSIYNIYLGYVYIVCIRSLFLFLSVCMCIVYAFIQVYSVIHVSFVCPVYFYMYSFITINYFISLLQISLCHGV